MSSSLNSKSAEKVISVFLLLESLTLDTTFGFIPKLTTSVVLGEREPSLFDFTLGVYFK